ncbi:MAG: RDD family protein [Planctomycetota bacterium]
MLQRLLIIATVVLLLVLGFQGYGGGPDAYFSIQMVKVNERPYLLLQYWSAALETDQLYYNIYTPRSANLDEWEAITTNPRLGPVNGMFVSKVLGTASGGTETASITEQLGLFHENRATFFDVSGQTITDKPIPLPFKWPAETAVQFKGVTYAFGAEQLPAAKESSRQDESIKGALRVARFDGKQWEELKIVGPQIEYRLPGFFLQAVALKDDVRIMWRQIAFDQVIHAGVEGPRAVGEGPLYAASFDGQTFAAQTTQTPGVPRGNMAAWSGEDRIHLLMQPGGKPGQSAYGNAPMEMWVLIPSTMSQTLEARRMETIAAGSAQPKAGLLKFISAEYVNCGDQEFIVRSNWQMFEIWNKTGAQPWTLVTRNPKGLPAYNLEIFLISILLLCLGLLAFGVGVAYRRRNLNWQSGRRVQPHDIYAPVGARMSAYAVDLILIFTVLILATQQLGWSQLSIQELLELDITKLPHAPFFLLYLAYLVMSEWLLGATLGKYILGLRVVMEPNRKLTLWAALLRNLIGFFERMPLSVIFVSMPMIIFTPRRQRLGDLLSRTFVVHKTALKAYYAQINEDIAMRTPDYNLFGPRNSKNSDEQSYESPASQDKNDKRSSS